MPLNVPQGFWQAKLRWSLIGDPEEMICTLGFGSDLPTSEEGAQAIANDIHTIWAGSVSSSRLCSAWTFQGVDVAGPPDSSGDVQATSTGLPQAGTGGENSLPQNCCALVRKTTSRGGRENTGRMYLPAGYLREGTVGQTGELDSTAMGLQDDLTDFYEGINASSTSAVSMVLFHNSDQEPTLVQSLRLQRIIATQRQRLRR